MRLLQSFKDMPDYPFAKHALPVDPHCDLVDLQSVSKIRIHLLVVLLLSLLLGFRPSFHGEPNTFQSPVVTQLKVHSHMLSDWLLVQLRAEDKDGYNPSILFSEAKRVGTDEFIPAARFSPPWYYLVVAPFAVLSPDVFVLLMDLLSIIAAIKLMVMSFELARGAPPPFWVLALSTAFFPPLLASLAAGQISVFLALVMVLALRSFSSRNDEVAGFWLAV